MFPYHLTKNYVDGESVKVLTVVIDGDHKIIKGEHAEKAVEAIKAGDEVKVKEIVDMATAVSKQSNGLFEIKNGVVYVEDQQLPESLSQKIVEFYENDLPYSSLVAFWHRLKKNPSYRSVQCLFSFLDHNSVPLTEDGCFLAYKGVRSDFKDVHSGTFDNSPGQVVSVPRNKVDDDPSRTCSYGLHVAAWNYVAGTYYGNSERYLEVKVDPEHVVAVPADYNFQKMRVCQYYVVKEITEKPSNVSPLVTGDEYNYDSEYEDDDDDDDQYEEGCGWCGDGDCEDEEDCEDDD